jgi:hypothetical protein
MRQFDRAYADMAKAKQIGSGKPTKTAALTAAPPQRKTSPVTVGNALNVAASDRFLDVPAQTIRSERR